MTTYQFKFINHYHRLWSFRVRLKKKLEHSNIISNSHLLNRSHSQLICKLACEHRIEKQSSARRVIIPDRSFCSESWRGEPWLVLKGEVDRYHGVWVDLSRPEAGELVITDLPEEEFDQLLKASLRRWRAEGITSVWLHFSLTQGRFLSTASRHGFRFHHAEASRATLVFWLDESQQSKIPVFATHQLGVSGVAVKEDTKEVLVVKDKNRQFKMWKFPGGLSDLGEDIETTAEREVFEETGVSAKFQSVLAFRQHHLLPGAFGRSDLYILCRLKPLTFDLHPCEKEIAECRWMPVSQLLVEKNVAPLTRRVADLLLLGLQEGFESVDIRSHEMASLYKGLKFHLFHR